MLEVNTVVEYSVAVTRLVYVDVNTVSVVIVIVTTARLVVVTV